jgi:hypothetical protein
MRHALQYAGHGNGGSTLEIPDGNLESVQRAVL